MSDAIPHAWPALSLDGRIGRSSALSRLALPRLPKAALVRLGLALMLLTGVVAALFALARSIAALAPAAALPVASPAASTTPMAMKPASWLDIVKPVHIYNLEARNLAKLPFTYSARRLDTGGARDLGSAREDRLDFGSWQADRPSLRLTILRDGASPTVSLDTAIVRQAADIGLAVSHSKLPDTLKTRFGTFEIADVGATKAATMQVTMACSGFRLGLTAPRLAIDGFACGTAGRPIPRKALACLIDRLDLVSAGEDRALIDFFATTDLRRDRDCDGMRLGPDVAHAAWLDTPDDPTPKDAPAAKHRRVRHRH